MSNDKSTLDGWMNSVPEEENSLYDEALRLYEGKRFKEALVLINVAIEHDSSSWKFYDLKGNILRFMDRFTESKRAFDEALEIKNDESVLKNKVEMMYTWANSLNDKKKALEIIVEAIDILPDNVDGVKFLYLKGSIYDCLSQPIEARKAYLTAEGEFEEVERLQAQEDFIKNSKDTLINITGTQFYYGLEVFAPGVIVDLMAEPTNPHDKDAIRVEIEGETVGYVANSDYTVLDNITCASDISDAKKAEIMFIYLEGYVIAKII